MNLHVPFTGRSKKPTTLTITPVGQQKLEHFEGTGLDMRALQILQDEGPTTLRELERKLGIDENKAKVLAKDLVRNKGWAIAQ